MKQTTETQKTFVLFEGWSNDCDGNRHRVSEFKAKDMNEAVKYVKENFVNPDKLDDIEENGDDENIILSYTYVMSVNGEVEEDDNDDDVNLQTEYFEIDQQEVEA